MLPGNLKQTTEQQNTSPVRQQTLRGGRGEGTTNTWSINMFVVAITLVHEGGICHSPDLPKLGSDSRSAQGFVIHSTSFLIPIVFLFFNGVAMFNASRRLLESRLVPLPNVVLCTQLSSAAVLQRSVLQFPLWGILKRDLIQPQHVEALSTLAPL